LGVVVEEPLEHSHTPIRQIGLLSRARR
jgi:hypothetical protein